MTQSDTERAPPATRKGLRGETLWAFAAKVGTGVFQFAMSILLVRMMSVSAFGFYEFAFRTLGFLLVVSNLGLTWKTLMLASAAERDSYPALGSDVSAILKLTLLWSAALSAGFVMFLNGSGDVVFDASPATILALFLIMPALTLLLVVSETFRGLRNIREASIFSGLFSNGVALAALVLLYVLGVTLGAASALAIIGLAATLACATACFVLNRSIPVFRLALPREKAKRFLREGMPFLLYNVLVAGALILDIWYVKAVFGNEEVGIYALASRIALFFLIPWMIASAVFRGRLARAIDQADYDTVRAIIAIHLKYLGVVSVAMVGGLALFGGPLLALFFPPAFAASLPPMLFLAAAFSVTSAFSVYGICILFFPGNILKFIVPIVQALVFAVGVGPLASMWGSTGVGAAMLLALSVAAVLQVVFCRHLLSQNIRE